MTDLFDLPFEDDDKESVVDSPESVVDSRESVVESPERSPADSRLPTTRHFPTSSCPRFCPRAIAHGGANGDHRHLIRDSFDVHVLAAVSVAFRDRMQPRSLLIALDNPSQKIAQPVESLGRRTQLE